MLSAKILLAVQSQGMFMGGMSPFPGSKRKRILERRERALIHALRNDAPPDQLHKAVEAVRTAMLYFIKARPCSPENKEKWRVEWEARSADQIVEIYRRRIDD